MALIMTNSPTVCVPVTTPRAASSMTSVMPAVKIADCPELRTPSDE